MGFRCELCASWLPLLSFCKLCPTCYKLRTIVQCYSCEDVLKKVEDSFLVSHGREEEEIRKDKKFFINEEKRIQKEFEEELAQLTKQKEEHLPTIKEEEPIQKEEQKLIQVLETPKLIEKTKSESDIPQSDDNSYSIKLRNGNKKKQIKSI